MSEREYDCDDMARAHQEIEWIPASDLASLRAVAYAARSLVTPCDCGDLKACVDARREALLYALADLDKAGGR